MVSAAWHGSTLPGRRHIQRTACPATHACLRPPRIIVRHDNVDHQSSGIARAGRLDLLHGAGRPARASASAPGGFATPIHSIGHGRSPPARRQANAASSTNAVDAVDIGAVDDGIDCKRQTHVPPPIARTPACGHARRDNRRCGPRWPHPRPAVRLAHGPAHNSCSRARRARSRPIAEVIRLVYRPAWCAAATMSTRSRRDAGSPPDRCTCSTPNAAASSNTLAQVAVSSSSARSSSASGFEQYGHARGQRCVSSASKPSGGGKVQPGRAAWSCRQHPLCDEFGKHVSTSVGDFGAIGGV